ncbi:unnamed protein product [Rotaria sp. Silwood2]|nr:unnamed protein product [Rotaria sp. Silwood2]CAF2672987.1 unnamed protein product [Rotaria sp. Silwood2]CAF3085734.1 unnamed protein product [Rotaria sp. Silwood2]CAF4032493.1 unnamed protein product [Rotaria sp. Silwood2]CAF4479472.1 unnamed protein product [Rotaria sp. Silwood2]
MNSNVTLCVGGLFRSINNFECHLSRITGLIIIFASLFSILFNIRFVYWSYHHRQNRSHHYLLILSMIFSSVLVIIVILPSVILQNLTCTRLCSLFYCQLEGFVSYLTGCVHMFMLMMISIIRYGTVLPTNTTKKYFQQHSYISVVICWLLALIFALPPLFNWNKYVPEGLGFHCGLNWFDRSFYSRLYLMLTFSFVYFIPLIVLSIVNIHVYYVIRGLLRRALRMNEQSLTKSSRANKLLTQERSLTPFISSSDSSISHANKLEAMKLSKIVTVGNHVRFSPTADPIEIRYAIHLRRLKADRHFALATIFLVSEYLLSWTPYACIALLYLFHIEFINEQSYLITISAFIAKTSMIINPFIYISTIKSNQLKIILYWKKCSCHYCWAYKN